MSYLNENGLARYDGLIKQWVTLKSGTVDGVESLLNWQKTETATSVTCYPLPAAPLDPVVNFLFTETGPAEGEKGPDNPSTITGVSSVKAGRAGKNLLFPEDFECGPDRGLTATVNQDGSVSVSGTTVGNGILRFRAGSTSRLNTIKNSPFLAGLTYTVSMECPDSNVVGYVHYSVDGGTTWIAIGSSFIGGQSRTFTLPAGTTGLQIWTQTTNGIILNTTVKMQCELGETATTFEKSIKDTYTINLGGTYYGGSVDLSAGTMTVTHYGYAFTGTEAGWWERTELENTVRFGAYSSSWGSIIQATKNHNTPVCSHFTLNYSYSSDTPHFYVGDTGNQYYFYPDHTLSRDDWKAWLAQQYAAGHPLTTSFELATPYTIQLTPQQIYSLSQVDPYTPRINTVYSDQVSVQVGYPKSPLATSTELTNAIISLGGNI